MLFVCVTSHLFLFHVELGARDAALNIYQNLIQTASPVSLTPSHVIAHEFGLQLPGKCLSEMKDGKIRIGGRYSLLFLEISKSNSTTK